MRRIDLRGGINRMCPLWRAFLSLRDSATHCDTKRCYQLREWPTRRIELSGHDADTTSAVVPSGTVPGAFSAKCLSEME